MNQIQKKADELNQYYDELNQYYDELGQIELEVMTEGYTLAQAMRDGCKVTKKAKNWEVGERACANSAALIGAVAKGIHKL